MDFDDAYRKDAHYFGDAVNKLLLKYAEKLPAGSVLDIGAGQGINTLFLARKGFSVDAIDPSRVGLQKISDLAKRENLNVDVFHTGFEDFETAHKYSLILLFGLLPILDRKETKILIERIPDWTLKNSLVLVTAFVAESSRFLRCWNQCKKMIKNFLGGEKGIVRTYFKPGELPEVFAGFEVLYYREYLGPLHTHAGSSPERHSIVEAVFRRS